MKGMSSGPEADRRHRAMQGIVAETQCDTASDEEFVVEIIRALARAAARRDHRKTAGKANTTISTEAARR